ncbi:hypothetical protein WN67_29495 [Mycolicibacterium obuense]|uniref:Uncharacterized protein n=2 Tax=Mycolicibacterium obuense TaxID=1807 RepID=A0A0M2JND6_9MYCO|nr:hypothetical protein WN67_29495 [Mycolicibacterium obuense]
MAQNAGPHILAGMGIGNSYVAQVDRILAAAVSLFPDQNSAPATEPAEARAAGEEIPEGGSGLAAAAEDAAARYRSDDARAAALSDAFREAVRDAATIATRAGETAQGIARAACAQAEVALGERPEPHNLTQLVRQMDGRLAAMQEHIRYTRQQLEVSAQQINAHAAEMAALRQA